jgi:hypothetical protein
MKYTSIRAKQGDSGGEVNVFIGDSIDNCEEKN